MVSNVRTTINGKLCFMYNIEFEWNDDLLDTLHDGINDRFGDCSLISMHQISALAERICSGIRQEDIDHPGDFLIPLDIVSCGRRDYDGNAPAFSFIWTSDGCWGADEILDDKMNEIDEQGGVFQQWVMMLNWFEEPKAGVRSPIYVCVPIWMNGDQSMDEASGYKLLDTLLHENMREISVTIVADVINEILNLYR